MANRWHAKWDIHGVKAAQEEARAAKLGADRARFEANSASRGYRNVTDELALVRQALDAVTAEREAYKTIAASHEVKWPELKEVSWESVWSNRRYQSTFDNNLERLQRDVTELKDKTSNGRVRIQVKIYPIGWWKTYLDKTYRTNWGNKDNVGQYVYFQVAGRVEEIGVDLLDLIQCMEDADHTPLFVSKNKKEWRAPSDPIVFEATASVWPVPKPEKPPIQIVEVLKTETKIVEVERFVEREAADPVKLDSELLAAVLEVETIGRKAMASRRSSEN